MTGGTLLVVKNNKYVLTKVAHDGFDLEDKIVKFKTKLHLNNPEDIVFEYLKQRNLDGQGDFDPYDSIKNKDLCVYIKNYENIDFEKALDRMEDELRNNPLSSGDSEEYDEDHPYNQLACCYSDYAVFINMDNKTIFLNGEIV